MRAGPLEHAAGARVTPCRTGGAAVVVRMLEEQLEGGVGRSPKGRGRLSPHDHGPPVRMRTVQTVRAVIDQALDLAEERFEVADGEEGRLAEAWLAHVMTTTRAVLLLNADGFGEVAAPMRRSVVEHAVWLSWITRHREEAVAVVHAKFREAVRRNEKALREWAGWASDQVDSALAIEKRHVPTTKDVIGELIATASEGAIFPMVWFGVYWLDSEGSHPGIGTARQEPEGGLDQWDAAIGAALVLALHAYSTLLPNDPWEPWVREVTAAMAEAVGYAAKVGSCLRWAGNPEPPRRSLGTSTAY